MFEPGWEKNPEKLPVSGVFERVGNWGMSWWVSVKCCTSQPAHFLGSQQVLFLSWSVPRAGVGWVSVGHPFPNPSLRGWRYPEAQDNWGRVPPCKLRLTAKDSYISCSGPVCLGLQLEVTVTIQKSVCPAELLHNVAQVSLRAWKQHVQCTIQRPSL